MKHLSSENPFVYQPSISYFGKFSDNLTGGTSEHIFLDTA